MIDATAIDATLPPTPPRPFMTDIQWVGCMLSGGTFYLYGKPVRATLEWPEGLPFGTEEQLREMGRKMRGDA
jgi:hypothetical protein